jgi:hypothetical protein
MFRVDLSTRQCGVHDAVALRREPDLADAVSLAAAGGPVLLALT